MDETLGSGLMCIYVYGYLSACAKRKGGDEEMMNVYA